MKKAVSSRTTTFPCRDLILKRNLQINVNGRFSSTWCVTLYNTENTKLIPLLTRKRGTWWNQNPEFISSMSIYSSTYMRICTVIWIEITEMNFKYCRRRSTRNRVNLSSRGFGLAATSIIKHLSLRLFLQICTEQRKILCTWLREDCSCCSLTVLPCRAWVLLNYVLQRIFLSSVYKTTVCPKVP